MTKAFTPPDGEDQPNLFLFTEDNNPANLTEDSARPLQTSSDKVSSLTSNHSASVVANNNFHPGDIEGEDVIKNFQEAEDSCSSQRSISEIQIEYLAQVIDPC